MALSNGPNLTPHDLLSLPRPLTPILSPSGTRALWPASTFDFDSARTDKHAYLVDLSPSSTSTSDSPSKTAPTLFLKHLTNLDLAWLDDNTAAFLRPALPHSLSASLAEDGKRADHPEGVNDDQLKKKLAAWRDLEGGDGTELWAKQVDSGDEYLVGRLPVPISDLSILQTSSSLALLSFSATVYPDGSLYTVARQASLAAERAAGSDAKTYDGLFARHWDEWSPTEGERKQVFVVRLERNPSDVAGSEEATEDESGTDSDESLEDFEVVEKPIQTSVGDNAVTTAGSRPWRMETEQHEDEAGVLSQKPKVLSPLAGTKLECPVGPFGGASDFSLSATHLLFHAKDPLLNPAWHTRTQVYLLPLSPRSASDAKPRQLTLGSQGACSSPVLSPDGKRAAWLEMRVDGYEADRNRVMLFEIESGRRYGVSEKWDRSPGAITWAQDGGRLFLTTEEEGHVKLFELAVPFPSASNTEADLEATYAAIEPTKLTHEHSLTCVAPLPLARTTTTSSAKDKSLTLLLSHTSLTHPNELSLLTYTPSPSSSSSSPPPKVTLTPLASLTRSLLALKALHEGEEFWFAGDKGKKVHGWVVFPPEMVEARKRGVGKEVMRKKYPLAMCLHGGPESAWNDGWSTRWNPNVFASAGYIVVAINRTGSTGFGQEFCEAILGDWGGAPFRDLVAGLEFVKTTYPEIDPERTAALGASYGGYMINWIQGHNEQTKFQALVCHDGVFNIANSWYTGDELYFPEHEFGKTPWENPEGYQKWSPHNHVSKWSTPQLVIHGSKDYRLVEGEGLAVFNSLQRLSVPSRLVVFPTENHWVLKPQNSARWHKEVLDWMNEWTAPSSSSRTEASIPAADRSTDEKKTPNNASPVSIVKPRSGYEVAYRD